MSGCLGKGTVVPVEYIAGVQLLLYGLGWVVAALLVREQRRVLAHWAAYGLAHAASVVLSTHALSAGVFPPAPALACSILGFCCIVRGVDVFASGRAQLDRLTFGVLVLGIGTVVVAEYAMTDPALALAVRRLGYQGSVAAVLLGSAPSLWRRLRQDYGRLTTAIGLTAGIVYGLLALVAMAMQLTMGAQQIAQVREASHVPNVLGSLVVSAIFNFGYLFLLMSRLIVQLRHSSAHDHLTSCLNRRAMEARLAQAWAQHARSGAGVAVALIDIDQFKRINDSLGHAVGDQALVFAARALAAHTRAGDIVGRWGGEEFLVLMPGSDRVSALAAGERLRGTLEAQSAAALGFTLTASVGVAVAEAGQGPATASALVASADRAMYRAKQGGRNRVELGAPLLAPAGGAPAGDQIAGGPPAVAHGAGVASGLPFSTT